MSQEKKGEDGTLFMRPDLAAPVVDPAGRVVGAASFGTPCTCPKHACTRYAHAALGDENGLCRGCNSGECPP